MFSSIGNFFLGDEVEEDGVKKRKGGVLSGVSDFARETKETIKEKVFPVHKINDDTK